jgi:hypothetical protein
MVELYLEKLIILIIEKIMMKKKEKKKIKRKGNYENFIN